MDWGTQITDPYLTHLDEQADRNGIEVPTFNSGVHHSTDPSGETPFQVEPSPWYSTEFWTDYEGNYGDMRKNRFEEKIRGTWKIIAFGGAGYNYYMAHGGTNFGYSGDGSRPGVSYDYSAPIGEAGQLRNFYFPARRAAYFAQSFTPLLTGSHNDPTLATCDQSALRVTARTNPNARQLHHARPFRARARARGRQNALYRSRDPAGDACHRGWADVAAPGQLPRRRSRAADDSSQRALDTERLV